MSFMETEGRSSRLRTRAQNLAITSESAPSSSKKWPSAATCSTRLTSASIPARMLSVPVARTAVTASARSLATSGPGSDGGLAAGLDRDVFVALEHPLAVDGLDPVGLVDGVEVALAEVRGDGDRGEPAGVMPGQPARRGADHGAGGSAEQEP